MRNIGSTVLISKGEVSSSTEVTAAGSGVLLDPDLPQPTQPLTWRQWLQLGGLACVSVVAVVGFALILIQLYEVWAS